MPSPAPARSIGSHLLAHALDNGLAASRVAFCLKPIELGAEYISVTIIWLTFITSLLSSLPLVRQGRSCKHVTRQNRSILKHDFHFAL